MELECPAKGQDSHFIEFSEDSTARWLDSTTDIPEDCLSVEEHINTVVSKGLSTLRDTCSEYEPVKFTCRITVRKKMRLASPFPRPLDMKLIDEVQIEAVYPNLSQ